MTQECEGSCSRAAAAEEAQAGGRRSPPRPVQGHSPWGGTGKLTPKCHDFPEPGSCCVLPLVKEPKVARHLPFTSGATTDYGQATGCKDLNSFFIPDTHSAERQNIHVAMCSSYQHFHKAEVLVQPSSRLHTCKVSL